MANKVENEQVVNRFLLSTTYTLIAGIGLFYLSEAAGRAATASLALTIYWVLIIAGGLSAVWFAIRKFVLKKGTCYYFFMFLYLCIAGVFLRYGNYLPHLNNMTRRILLVGACIGVLYIYELVVYFLRVNKVDGKKKK